MQKQKKRTSWITDGLLWGLFMFTTMTFIIPFCSGKEITIISVLVAIPVWTIGGLIFGYIVKRISRKQRRREY